jgi:hypothetical protein
MKQIEPVWGKTIDRGYIGFSNCPGNIISEAITHLENIEEAMKYGEDLLDGGISHVFIVWDQNWLIESAQDGVKFESLDARINDPALRIIFRKPTTYDNIYVGQLLGAARKMLNEPYDYTGLVGYIGKILDPFNRIPFIGNWINKLPVPLHLKGEFCSAFVSDCMKQTANYHDWPLFKELNITRISPNILWNRGPWTPLKFDNL